MKRERERERAREKEKERKREGEECGDRLGETGEEQLPGATERWLARSQHTRRRSLAALPLKMKTK